MANLEFDFHVLDVGQGTCNYVELTVAKKVTTNILIDLGTKWGTDIATGTVDFVAEQALKRSGYPKIDLVLISHGDGDHYNLIVDVLEKIGGNGDKQVIGQVLYGGDKAHYADDFFATLGKYTMKLSSVPNSSSCITKSGAQPKALWGKTGPNNKLIDPVVYNLIANVPEPSKSKAWAKNTSSLVVGVVHKGQCFIATGDATATTFFRLNEIRGKNAFPWTTQMITLPHHGSRPTTYCVGSGKATIDLARKSIASLLDWWKPQSATISCADKKYHHPSISMVDDFARHATGKHLWSDPQAGAGYNFVTCWTDLDSEVRDPANKYATPQNWPAPNGYLMTRTNRNVYSTMYFRDEPYNEKVGAQYPRRYTFPPGPPAPVSGMAIAEGVAGRSWQYALYNNKPVQLWSYPNKHRTIAARAEFVAQAPSPLATRHTAAARSGDSGVHHTPTPRLRDSPRAQPSTQTAALPHLRALA